MGQPVARLIHHAPRKKWLRNRLDDVVQVFFHPTGFVGCCFESDIDFYVRTFRMDIRALEARRQAPFGGEDLEKVLPLHARFNLLDLT